MLRKHRKTLCDFSSSNSNNGNISYDQFWRWFLLVRLETVINLSIGVVTLAQHALTKNFALNIPYSSCTSIPFDFSFTATSFKGYWSPSSWSLFQVRWAEWQPVFSALLFFAVFGTTVEARKKMSEII